MRNKNPYFRAMALSFFVMAISFFNFTSNLTGMRNGNRGISNKFIWAAEEQ
jgi:hypothetical protein